MTHSNDAFDAEISKMFGSLSLRAWAHDTSVQVSLYLSFALDMPMLTALFEGSISNTGSKSPASAI